MSGELPADFAAHADAYARKLQAEGPVVASRKASQMALDAFGPKLPELIGGSADLAGSNLTIWKGSKDVNANDANANYVYYGVREFGMSAISQRPRAARRLHSVRRDVPRVLRLRAQRGAHVGADPGARDPRLHARFDRPRRRRPDASADRASREPALDPEQPRLASVRRGRIGCRVEGRDRTREGAVVPGIFAAEPCASALARDEQIGLIERGGYVLADPGEREVRRDPDRDRIGSRTSRCRRCACCRAKASPYASSRCRARTYSIAQPLAYRESVLPSWCRKRVAIEAGVTDYWRKYVGLDGAVIGIDTFGASAPAEALFQHFGFTVEHVVAAVKALALSCGAAVLCGGSDASRSRSRRARSAPFAGTEYQRETMPSEQYARDHRAHVPDAHDTRSSRRAP